MSLVVGLTGGIGSGKSTVAELFAALGAPVVDTDAIAHELTGPQGDAMSEIAAAFGDAVLRADGGLDRAAMRRLAFSDPGAKRRLEAILHPLIRSMSRARVARALDDAPYVLLVVPLLVESPAYAEAVDRILLVDCDETLQRQRVMARSGLSPHEVQAIIDSQASRARRLAAADDVIANNDGREALSAPVAALHQRYVALSARHAAGD